MKLLSLQNFKILTQQLNVFALGTGDLGFNSPTGQSQGKDGPHQLVPHFGVIQQV